MHKFMHATHVIFKPEILNESQMNPLCFDSGYIPVCNTIVS